MAQRSESRLYSTLEVVRDDPFANAPQRDYSVVAPEVIHTYDEPEVAIEAGPELFFDRTLPEVVAVDAEKTDSVRTPKTYGIPTRTFRIIKAVLLAIVVAIAVGLGLGLGLFPRRSSSQHLSTMLGLTTATATATPTLSSNATPTTTSAGSTNFSTSLSSEIRNNTALSAVIGESGDRRLFFQDSSGLIKQCYYANSTRQWVAAVDDVVAADAKNNTPIAAYFSASSSATHIYYVSKNNSLASRYFTDHSWVVDNSGIAAFVASPEASLLTVKEYPVSGGSGPEFPRVSLMYESVNGSISTLTQSFSNFSLINSGSWAVANQSTQCELNNPRRTVGLTSSDTSSGYSTALVMATTIHANQSNNALGRYTIGIHQFVDHEWITTKETLLSATPYVNNFDITQVSYYNHTSEHIFVYSMMVNETIFNFLYFFDVAANIWNFGPAVVDGNLTRAVPSSPFPFPKLASAGSLVDEIAFSVFHQLNNTAFIEDEYNVTSGLWTSTVFTIET